MVGFRGFDGVESAGEEEVCSDVADLVEKAGSRT